MEPVARVVRKSPGLNIESVELARSRSWESYRLVRVRELPMARDRQRLRQAAGGELEQIQSLLSHASIQTTDTSDSKRQAFTAEPPVG